MKSDTPRTDAFQKGDGLLETWEQEWEAAISFARELESELAAEIANRKKCCRDGNQISDELFDTQQMLKKADAEVERLKRLLSDLLILTEKNYRNSTNYKQIKEESNTTK
jgi:hypothetical protein